MSAPAAPSRAGVQPEFAAPPAMIGAAGSTGAGAAIRSDMLDASALPADVCSVLQRHACVTCHQTPAMAGAPMPLQLRADFVRNAPDGSSMAKHVLARAQDAQRPMPPASTSRPLMPAADLSILQQWIDSGMPGVSGSACAANEGPPSSSLGAPAWATSEWPADQCEYVMTLGAHGTVGTPFAQDKTGFPIPAEHTSYNCFYEKVPWGDKKVQALAVRARIESPDDMQYVHHLVVSGILPFQTSIAGAAPNGPGDLKPCDNPSGGTINVWAPGSFNPLSYPSDVGVLLPSGEDAYMELQVHYNNPDKQAGKQSRVQYDVCVTSKMRPQTAAVFWLGYENAFVDTLINRQEASARLDNQKNGTAVGKCAAKTKTRILNIMPHMHEQGRHSKVEVVRKSGMTELVLDKPFDFRDQTSYFSDDLWLEPGDVVRSTCTWDKGPVYFGFASDSEMCFFYTLAYPVEGFAPDGSEKGFIGSGGNQACAASAGP